MPNKELFSRSDNGVMKIRLDVCFLSISNKVKNVPRQAPMPFSCLVLGCREKLEKFNSK